MASAVLADHDNMKMPVEKYLIAVEVSLKKLNSKTVIAPSIDRLKTELVKAGQAKSAAAAAAAQAAIAAPEAPAASKKRRK